MVTKAKADEKKSDERTVDLYNANDGLHGRDGGPYLDQVEQLHFERQQAAREGSEPDLEHPRSYPGILLRTGSEQVSQYNPTILAGDDRREFDKIQAIPVATDVPVVRSVESDFSSTDTEDKGDVDEFELMDPPLFDNPAEANVSAAVEASTTH